MNPTSCFSSYNSIEQFRTMMKDFKKAKQNPSFNIPDIVTFTGSVKLHGTNAGVCFNNKVGMFCQSRNNIINLTYDNQGFAFFVEKNKAKFEEFFKIISEKYNINLDENTISIYGEWCGERIQKGVALTQLPKCFCIFDCKISNIKDKNENTSYWVDISFKSNDNCVISFPSERIYNIYDFDIYTIDINIDEFEKAQEKLTELTESVEKCCPFAKKLGIEGTGEGIVWRYWYNSNHRWIFKTKGEMHKVTKEKVLIPVDTEKIENINMFIENTCTLNRFNQAIDSLYKINPESKLYSKSVEMKHCPDIINWIRDDILKEEMQTILDNNFNMRDIIPHLSKKVVKFMKNNL